MSFVLGWDVVGDSEPVWDVGGNSVLVFKAVEENFVAFWVVDKISSASGVEGSASLLWFGVF